jgi:membrane-associated phospholipid phosphatase
MTTRQAARPIFALLLGGILVAVCYFFVDRTVALFVHGHRFYPDEVLRWPPLVSDWLGYAIVAGILGVVAWRILVRGGPRQTLLAAIAANLVLTFAIKSLLKWAFGRAWPETWIDNNPSLIANGVYGFHPFQFNTAWQSFPSGHAAATFAVVSILWLARPRWRWLYGLVSGLICLALVGLNYHFVGDVLAGAMLGSTTGYCIVQVFGLSEGSDRPSKEPNSET